MENTLNQVIRKDCYKHKINDEAKIRALQNEMILKYKNHEYDFSQAVQYKLFTQGKKKRDVAIFPEESLEYHLVKALNLILKQKAKVSYSSRNKIILGLFDTLKTISKFKDYTIVRFDFKNYFDSLSNLYIYHNLLARLNLPREVKDLLEEYSSAINRCKAGLPLSNIFAEMIGQLFDEEMRSSFKGIIYYARYVDDGIIIFNNIISKDECEETIKKVINKIFYQDFNGCIPNKTQIDFSKKFAYITEELLPQKFDYLGYEINLSPIDGTKISLGIAEGKRKKFKNKTKSIIQKYYNDIEKLRIILLLLSRRVVYTIRKNNDVVKWITKGIIYNYNELNFFGEIEKRTQTYLESIYTKCFAELRIPIPYFLKGKNSNKGYNLFYNLQRNKAFVLDDKIGIHRDDLIKLIKIVDATFDPAKKGYHELIKELLIQCKIGY